MRPYAFRARDRWGNGIETGVPVPVFSGELSAEDVQLIDWMADQVVRRGLAMPAVLFLESSKPLSFVGSQMMHVASPFFKAVFGRPGSGASFDRVACLMEDRDNVERLLLAIERKQDACGGRSCGGRLPGTPQDPASADRPEKTDRAPKNSSETDHIGGGNP